MEWFIAACGLYVVIAFVTDVRSMKIPNLLTLPVTALGVLAHGIWDGWEGLIFSAGGSQPVLAFC